jgi:hypothetical protein
MRISRVVTDVSRTKLLKGSHQHQSRYDNCGEGARLYIRGHKLSLGQGYVVPLCPATELDEESFSGCLLQKLWKDAVATIHLRIFRIGPPFTAGMGFGPLK